MDLRVDVCFRTDALPFYFNASNKCPVPFFALDAPHRVSAELVKSVGSFSVLIMATPREFHLGILKHWLE